MFYDCTGDAEVRRLLYGSGGGIHFQTEREAAYKFDVGKLAGVASLMAGH